MDILTLGKISQVKRETDLKIEELDTAVKTSLSTTTAAVDQNIAQAVCNLNTSLTATETTLNGAMSTLDTTLNSQLSTLSSDTTSSLTGMSDTIANCMTCVDQDVSACFEANSGANYGVQWIYNCCGMNCSRCGDCNAGAGKCCLYTVPAGINRIQFEVWSAGGSGAGGCNYYCCMTSTHGGGGGNYGTKTIDVTPGWTYTVCAGDTYRCCAHTWSGGRGCKSFVSGCNVGLCAFGGMGGKVCNCGAWGWQQRESCHNGDGAGFCGADFGMMGTTGVGSSNSGCHCYTHNNASGQAPMIGLMQMNTATETWCSCACHTNWPAGGGMNGESNYCGNHAKCCAAGHMGGSGVVRITTMG